VGKIEKRLMDIHSTSCSVSIFDMIFFTDGTFELRCSGYDSSTAWWYCVTLVIRALNVWTFYLWSISNFLIMSRVRSIRDIEKHYDAKEWWVMGDGWWVMGDGWWVKDNQSRHYRFPGSCEQRGDSKHWSQYQDAHLRLRWFLKCPV